MIEFQQTSTRKKGILFCAVLFISVFALYFPSLEYGYISMDSHLYLEDAEIQSGISVGNIKRAFQRTDILYWQPLTLISHMVDIEIWGLDVGMHHLANILLHGLSSILLFHLLYRYFGGLWKAALIAAWFALHPLRVEPVIWMAGRKDCLSLFFFLLTLLAYFKYTAKPSIALYSVICITFALGILSKPIVIVTPCILLLLDYWPLNRLRKEFDLKRLAKLVIEKLPLFGLSALCGFITIFATNQNKSMSSLEADSIGDRIANMILNYWESLTSILWPRNMSVFHTGRTYIDTTELIIASTILLLISLLAIRTFKKAPYLYFGYAWYLITLFPVSGIMQAGSQSIANRFTYLPSIGVGIAIVWALGDLYNKRSKKNKQQNVRIPTILSIATILALSISSLNQVLLWRNPTQLFQYAIDHTEDNWMAHSNQGIEWIRQEANEKAIEAFMCALRIRPDDHATHLNIAGIIKDSQQAIKHLRYAIQMNPEYTSAYQLLIQKLIANGENTEAAILYPKLLELTSNAPTHLSNYAAILSELGRNEEAVPIYAKAVELEPKDLTTLFNQARNYQQLGMLDQAVIIYNHLLTQTSNTAPILLQLDTIKAVNNDLQ